jgi:hypothetical protein
MMVTHPELRPGQAFFHTLWHDDRFIKHAPGDVAACTDLDPFNRDDVVPAFLTTLAASWNQER